MKIERIEFVRSAAGQADLPREGAPELAMVGRSNVGKSSLINALVRQTVARTSSTPGKTRLVNLYRLRLPSAPPFYLADLPGYGHAGGKDEAARLFRSLTDMYFGRPETRIGGLLALDARHPGLANDMAAYEWLLARGVRPIIVATKVDKLSRSERTQALRRFGELFEDEVLPVSAASREGLDQLWRLIVTWVNNNPPHP